MSKKEIRELTESIKVLAVAISPIRELVDLIKEQDRKYEEDKAKKAEEETPESENDDFDFDDPFELKKGSDN